MRERKERTESVRLPKSIIDKARVLAQAERRTLSGMITHAFEEFLFWREHIKQFVKWLADKEVKELPAPEKGEKDNVIITKKE